jgi:hypothetical protein
MPRAIILALGPPITTSAAILLALAGTLMKRHAETYSASTWVDPDRFRSRRI